MWKCLPFMYGLVCFLFSSIERTQKSKATRNQAERETEGRRLAGKEDSERRKGVVFIFKLFDQISDKLTCVRRKEKGEAEVREEKNERKERKEEGEEGGRDGGGCDDSMAAP